MKNIIRLNSIHIENIKNVANATISFPNYDSNQEIRSNIIGLYGQNGSGKTASVNAFRIIQMLIGGQPIQKYRKYQKIDALYSLIEVVFNFITGDENLRVSYGIKISKLGQLEETLSYKNLSNNQKSFVTYNEETIKSNKILTPQQRVHDFGINKSNQVSYLVAMQKSIETQKSFFFNPEFSQTLVENLKDEYFQRIIKDLPIYVKEHMFIIENSRLTSAATNMIFPISLLYNNSQGEEAYFENTFGDGINSCNEHQYKAIEQGITSINAVISTIIPQLSIKLIKKNEIKTEFEKRYTFELIAKRDGIEIPYTWESDGIKKLISYVSCLIHMYNHENTLVVADEFDSGVFEFLIGEMLQVLKEGALGQLFFTSHNLRPLEVLDPKDIWFATTNPNNRFIQFTNIKNNNNLRDLYFRTIQLGGQKEEIYHATDQYKIRNAFTKVDK